VAHTRDSKPRAASGLSSAFALAVLLLAVYLQTFGGVFHSIDEEVYLHLTASLAERASFSVEPVSYWPDFGVAEGVDGRLYANRGPGLALAALPFYWLGVGLAEAEGTAGLVPSSSIDVPTTVTLSLTLLNCLTVTALDVLLYLALLRLGYSARVAVSVALLFGLGTLASALRLQVFLRRAAAGAMLPAFFLLPTHLPPEGREEVAPPGGTCSGMGGVDQGDGIPADPIPARLRSLADHRARYPCLGIAGVSPKRAGWAA